MGMTGLAILIGLLVGCIALLAMLPFIVMHVRNAGSDATSIDEDDKGNARAWFSLGSFRASKRAVQISDEQLHEGLSAVLAIYPHLEGDERTRIDSLSRAFLARVAITASGPRPPTPIMCITIAGNAALPCLHPKASTYPRLRKVMVMPPGQGTALETPEKARRKGQLHLAWDDIVGAADHADSSAPNHVIRAFAGLQTGITARDNFLPTWASEIAHAPAIIGAERNELEHGDTAWLFNEHPGDRREFFLAMTDAFFRHPHHFSRNRHALYELLSEFYAIDTARVIPAPARPHKRPGLIPTPRTLLGVVGRFSR